MQNADLAPDVKVESVSLEFFKTNIRNKFREDVFHFETGSLCSKYPTVERCVVEDGSVEYPGTWGRTYPVLIQERDMPNGDKMLFWYKSWK